MSDLIDRWNEDREQYMTAAVAKAAAAAAQLPPTNGRCRNCDEPLVPPTYTDPQGREIPRRWCDHDCMMDEQMRVRAERMAPTATNLPMNSVPVARVGSEEPWPPAGLEEDEE